MLACKHCDKDSCKSNEYIRGLYLKESIIRDKLNSYGGMYDILKTNKRKYHKLIDDLEEIEYEICLYENDLDSSFCTTLEEYDDVHSQKKKKKDLCMV
jgi:hypothetical protein